MLAQCPAGRKAAGPNRPSHPDRIAHEFVPPDIAVIELPRRGIALRRDPVDRGPVLRLAERHEVVHQRAGHAEPAGIGRDEEVLTSATSFAVYAIITQAVGGKITEVPMRDLKFDLEAIARQITPRTKLLILNSPHNPTGGLLTRQNLEDIATILRKHPQIWIYSDEIYSRLTYDESYTSIASMPGMYERTIIADGASKAWAMTGWRIGFASNPLLAQHFTRWVINTESCASQISQWAAVEAIGGAQETTYAMRDEFHARRYLIVKLLNEVPGVTCRMPGGAFYAWPNVTEACKMTGIADSEELRKRLLNEAGVAVLSDIHFGQRVPGDGEHVRFSYAASREMIQKGVERMRDFIVRNMD